MATPAAAIGWQELGAVPPGGLVAARLQLHHAAQWLPRLVRAHLPPEPGFAHLGMLWDAALAGLVGRPVPSPAGPFRLGLQIAALSLVLRSEEGAVLGELALDGRTAAEAEAWLVRELARLGLGAVPLSPPFRYDLPPHPLQAGAAFSLEGEREALAELARWLANGALLLGPAMRCWSHHFDLARLEALGEGRSIGAGLSLGDGFYAEPYLYAYPWPYPAADALPPLPAPLFWHREGFTGAVLRGSDLIRLPDQAVQAQSLLDHMATSCGRALAGPSA